MAKITRDVIESYLACHYKAFLKLTEHGIVSLDNSEPLLSTAILGSRLCG
jgi:hypothetical protein